MDEEDIREEFELAQDDAFDSLSPEVLYTQFLS